MLRLKKTKLGNFTFVLDEELMSFIQGFLSSDPNLTDLDKCVMQAIHDYCWAWNKLDLDEMNEGLNGKGTFEKILNDELKWWSKKHNVNLDEIKKLECTRCGNIVNKLSVLRNIELNRETHCPQCPGQDFNGKQLKLKPID